MPKHTPGTAAHDDKAIMTLRFLSRGDIAAHLGVALSTVKGYRSFPPPDVIVGRNQGWARETVDNWAAGRQKRLSVGADKAEEDT